MKAEEAGRLELQELDIIDENQIYSRIAEKIGDTLTLDDIVREVVELSRRHRVIYHGIKNRESVKQISKYGLKPITPMSGPCSSWSTGLALFEPDMNSPFFNYSGNYSEKEPNVCELNLAIAKYDSLQKKGVRLSQYEEDPQINAYDVIPPEELTLIKVRIAHPITDDSEVLRSYRQLAEQQLLGAIYVYLMDCESEKEKEKDDNNDNDWQAVLGYGWAFSAPSMYQSPYQNQFISA